jgi:soluble lytic murein transglycosylase
VQGNLIVTVIGSNQVRRCPESGNAKRAEGYRVIGLKILKNITIYASASVALAAIVAGAPALAAALNGKIPLPKPRPAIAGKNAAQASAAGKTGKPTGTPAAAIAKTSNAAMNAYAFAGSPHFLLRTGLPRAFREASIKFAAASSAVTSEADIAAVKRVLEFSRKGKDADAISTINTISDPLARKLAEYLYLKNENSANPSFERFAAFIEDNPSWPHIPLLTRRAENALWDDKRDDAAIRAFYAKRQPTSAKGRLVLARVLLTQGDRAGAQALVRQAWRNDEMSSDVEARALEMFSALLLPGDHRARMNLRLYANDFEGGLRAAHRLGATEIAIARARIAVAKKGGGDAKSLLDAVPAAGRNDAGYLFAKSQYLRKKDEIGEAAKLMLTAPTDIADIYDADQWWVERRLLVRKALDDGDAQTAYKLAVNVPSPTKGTYRADQNFTCGWLALRFLNDPVKAAAHFARIPDGTDNPHALSRAGYWEGRAAEAMGRVAEAKAFYEGAAVHSATYYGQLARGKLGLPEVGLRPPPAFTPPERAAANQLEIVRALEILYKLDERDIIASIMAEMGERATDAQGLAAMGEVAERYKDGRSLVLMGKAAHGRGLPFEHYAFPTVGLPSYNNVGPAVEPAVTYSIARQESHFNQKTVSPANAMGFMQVTPAAAQYIAKKFKVAYDRGRLLSDPVYNMQMGAAELGNLIDLYRGSYIMTFAGYNAGQGRVRQWVAAYGDPRDPKIDPVDWVERIPIAETRNYVPRILENLQVYRVRFGGGSKLLIEADIRRGSEAN